MLATARKPVRVTSHTLERDIGVVWQALTSRAFPRKHARFFRIFVPLRSITFCTLCSIVIQYYSLALRFHTALNSRICVSKGEEARRYGRRRASLRPYLPVDVDRHQLPHVSLSLTLATFSNLHVLRKHRKEIVALV